MEGLVEVASAVRAIKYPAMRREVVRALASLADVGYQERAWLHHDYPPPTQYDDLDLVVHQLFDDNCVLPDPETRVGTVLFEGDEVTALWRLGEVFSPLIDRLGDVPDVEYQAATEWPEVTRLAGLALAAMVRAGIPCDHGDD
jgi:hypothetical protein